MSGGTERTARQQGQAQGAGARTSLTGGLKLSWVTVLAIAGHRASSDLDHVAGIGPQPIQLHGVLLAGHSGGDALILQCQQEGSTLRSVLRITGLILPQAQPTVPSHGSLYSQGSPALSGGHHKALAAH